DDLFARAFDFDPGNAGAAVTLLDVLANLLVLHQQLGEILLVGVPGALPIDHDAGAKTSRPNFLTHIELVPVQARSASKGSLSPSLALRAAQLNFEVGQGNASVGIRS